MRHPEPSRNPAMLSYYAMRRTVGYLALSLPSVLGLGAILFSLAGPVHALPVPLVQRSISDYYYTPMRNYFEGALCAIAAFLMTSRGYDWQDELLGYLAGLFTLGVAVFPPPRPACQGCSAREVQIGFIHSGFAGLMFLALAYFCLFLFRRSEPGAHPTPRKRHRNHVYAVCGATMLLCLAGLVGFTLRSLLLDLAPSPALFWIEAAGLSAFGVAWLTKGKGILNDRPANHNHHGG